MPTLAELKVAYEAARAKKDADPTPENMDALRAAWAAFDAAAPRQKTTGYASRAGKRQAHERRGR